MGCIQCGDALLRNPPRSIFKTTAQINGSLRSSFPNSDLVPTVPFRMLVIFEGKHPGPLQSIRAFDDSRQNNQDRFGLKANSFLGLVVKRTIEAA